MSLPHFPRRVVATLVSLLLIGGVLIPASAASAAEDGDRSSPTNAAAPWWVEWLEVFDLNDNKIDDLAERKAGALISAGKPLSTVPVLLTFTRALPEKSALVDFLGAQNAYYFKTQPVVDLDVPAQNVARLTGLPGLAAVEYDMKLRPALNVSAPATQANRGVGSNTFYNGKTAEDLGYTGEGTTIAVLDTGVQDVHHAFTGKWIAGAYVAAPTPVNCVNPPDGDGHGSHVASTALGTMPSPDDLHGTAKSAKLVEIKISIDAVAASATIGGIARGFDFVKRYNDALAAGTPLCGPSDDHIDVATVSFGSTGRGGPNAGTDEAFIDALVNSGVAVTIAAGNCGPSPSSTCTFGDDDNGISSPANAAGAIAVASFNDGGTVTRANDAISGFSSRGPNNGSGDVAAGGATSAGNLKDRYRKPEIAAPGENIEAAGVAPLLLNTLSGTSMAAPHVAGIAALLTEAGEDVKDQTGGRNLMASTGNGFVSDNYAFGAYPVRDAIVHSAEYKAAGAKDLWTGPNSRGVQWNNAWGYGQVNAFGALCWAWENVLVPGGATPPADVASGCQITGGNPTLNISSPADGASVPAGMLDVSGVANRDGGVKELTATLSGPATVANGTTAAYSVDVVNAAGDATCTITAEGSPNRSNESADGCSASLTWTTDGVFTVTGEATDGTSIATSTLDVTVSTPSGVPEPDGTISGGITIFGANPLLAHNEVVSLVTAPVDPAPKFLPGEAANFHTRFSADSAGSAGPGDAFTWHIWSADGDLVDTAGCLAVEDSDTTGAVDGFDCEANFVLPSEVGRYYTTLRLAEDGRWLCHNGQPIVDPGLDTGVPECIKAFDIGATAPGAPVAPGAADRRVVKAAMPYLVAAGMSPDLAWSSGDARGIARVHSAAAAEAAAAPSQVPSDPEVTDATGDVTGAGLPITHMDVEAAWFENDASFLYVGLKLTDIPADTSTTAQIAYNVNFYPDWVTQAEAKAPVPAGFGVPAANTFNGLRVQGIFSLLGFNGLTSPSVKDTHHAELQHLSASAPPPAPGSFGKVADLELVSVDPDTDIIWWAVPREQLLAPAPGDSLSGLGADTVPAVRGLLTMGSFYGDSAVAAAETTYELIDTEAPLSAVSGGPYAGAPNTPIAISGSGRGGSAPYACRWTGPAGATFGDASACDTTVTFGETGTFAVDLTVTDDVGNEATASAPVVVAEASGERVEISVEGEGLAGIIDVDTSTAQPSADWSVPVDLSALSGQRAITARWFDADDNLLGEDSVSVTVEPVGPQFSIDITSPSDGAEVKQDFVVEGTTAGTASEAAGQGSRSSVKWKRAVKVIPADHLKTSHGPPVPADSVGIGPGSTLLTNFIDPADGLEYVGICTAAFIFRDTNTGKVYLAAAGHCFVGPDATSSHGPDANWDRDLTRRVRVCVSTCIGGASGLVSAASLDMYPGTTRDLGELAYARQTLDGVDIGNDFGIVEIPPALHDEIRTDLPVWNGPSTADPLLLEGGEFLAQYGNGIGVGEVFPTKARMGIGAGISGGSWLAAMASSQGDSGSAVVGAEATVGTASSVDGLAPLGMLTHLSCCLIAGNPYNTAGTTLTRALEMAREDAGIDLELIHDPSQLETTVPAAPTGLAANAEDGAVALTWTAPSNGGAPITDYTVKWGTLAGGPYTETESVSGTEVRIEGLTNDVTYHFVVSATNVKGEGPDSLEVSSTPTRLSTVPGAPLNLSALAGDGQVALSWQAPDDDGGTPITGYTVKFGPTAGGPYTNTIPVNETAATVTGLTNGVTYHFVVSANNENGAGQDSQETQATPQAFVSPYTVEVRVLGSGTSLNEWTAVDSYDGSTWAKNLNDVASGGVTLEARLLEDGAEVARDSVAVVVASAATRLSLRDAGSDAAGSFTDHATLKAVLVADEDGAPIGDAPVTFELTGQDGASREWTAITGNDGVAAQRITLDMPAGSYNLVARFAGNEDHELSSDQMAFTVDREVSGMSLSVTGNGSNTALNATLTEDDGPGVAGRQVTFFSNGEQIGTATTNANGLATLANIPGKHRGGHRTFEARFAGNDSYEGSSASRAT
jgi:Subtilase family/Fibronectin type III domain